MNINKKIECSTKNNLQKEEYLTKNNLQNEEYNIKDKINDYIIIINNELIVKILKTKKIYEQNIKIIF
jgi:hypothetical protein